MPEFTLEPEHFVVHSHTSREIRRESEPIVEVGRWGKVTFVRIGMMPGRQIVMEVNALNSYVKPEGIFLKFYPANNEKWVQDRVAEDPSILGLGELVLRDRERVLRRCRCHSAYDGTKRGNAERGGSG